MAAARGGRAGQHRPALPGASGRARAAARGATLRRGRRRRAERQPLRPRQPDPGGARGEEFGDALLVLDGGACPVGIESAIVDCTRAQPVLLRPGVLTRARIEAVLGRSRCASPTRLSPRASGTLEAHYAPRAKLRLMPSADCASALAVLGDQPRR